MGAKLICDLIREVGKDTLQELLEKEIIKLANQMNIANNVNATQVPFIAETLLDQYPTDSLADFILVFKRGAIGYYGNTYHKLDAATIMEWMTKHIEEKAMYRERDETTAKTKFETEMVDYEAYRLKIEAKRKEMKETEGRNREAAVKMFVSKAENTRKAWTVPLEDENGNPLGDIENVLAESMEDARQIVAGLIAKGELMTEKPLPGLPK